MTTREIRYCNTVVGGCTAPAGYAVGGNVGMTGTFPGEKGCRGTCYTCGDPVCSNCSRRLMRHGKQRRVCYSCQEPKSWDVFIKARSED